MATNTETYHLTVNAQGNLKLAQLRKLRSGRQLDFLLASGVIPEELLAQDAAHFATRHAEKKANWAKKWLDN